MLSNRTIPVILGCIFAATLANGQERNKSQDNPYVPFEEPKSDQSNSNHFKLVEPFTANMLSPGEVKIGRDLDYGLTSDLMLGTKLVSLIIGAPTVQTKYNISNAEEHLIAIGLSVAHFNRNTFLWFKKDTRENFESLNATIARPSIAWSNKISDRLNLHTYWGVGFGKARAKLSEKGARTLWESKYPDGDWETRDDGDDTIDNTNSNSKKNQETRQSSRSISRTKLLEIQQLTEIASDLFQITGEFKRIDNKKILVSTSIEQVIIEDLKAEAFQLTVAQQWIIHNISLRIGVGLQYQVLSGEDLDGEKIEDTGFLPAADVDFYYRF
mgnify:CR=1 FL=1